MNTELATKAIQSIPKVRIDEYTKYWESLTPKTYGDMIRRWIFAFMSVHTSWQRNVMGYEALADLSWLNDSKELLSKITKAGVGLQNQRIKGIKHMLTYLDCDMDTLRKESYPDLGWQQYRNLLVGLFKGMHIGMAKVSFAIELMYPLQAKVVCLDAHMLKLYGYTGKSSFKPGDKDYIEMENHWLGVCSAMNYHPTIARHAYWDTLQKQSNTRYWSHVFETVSNNSMSSM